MFFLSWVTGLGGETITSTVSSGVDVLPVLGHRAGWGNNNFNCKFRC